MRCLNFSIDNKNKILTKIDSKFLSTHWKSESKDQFLVYKPEAPNTDITLFFNVDF